MSEDVFIDMLEDEAEDKVVASRKRPLLTTVRQCQMECQKCGGHWISPQNFELVMQERDRAITERDSLWDYLRRNFPRVAEACNEAPTVIKS